MKEKVIRKLFLGFINLHILHHAKNGPIFGQWMIEELKEHGYDISPGTLYPIFHKLENEGLIFSKESVVEGKIRKYYRITEDGEEVLNIGKNRAKELIIELEE
ncbi:PadR family transcriptional regulator [Brassicibacter mesophilus]|uniref:PadR family transcriptional regulator n=1 Tax=Brassicibacter mesophilus TaxID=745119 RepID=UPI003D196818